MHCVHVWKSTYKVYVSAAVTMSLRAVCVLADAAPHVLSNWQERRHMEPINSRLLAH